MSNRKFTWCQDLEGNSGSQSFNTLSSKFGDGYEQNTSIGINNRSGTWQYTRTAVKPKLCKSKRSSISTGRGLVPLGFTFRW